jgi:hypothetical protein
MAKTTPKPKKMIIIPRKDQNTPKITKITLQNSKTTKIPPKPLKYQNTSKITKIPKIDPKHKIIKMTKITSKPSK